MNDVNLVRECVSRSNRFRYKLNTTCTNTDNLCTYMLIQLSQLLLYLNKLEIRVTTHHI